MKKLISAALFCFLLCGSLFAQAQQVTLRKESTSFEQVFKEIESQTGMSVDYDAQEVKASQTVKVKPGTYTVKALLDNAFKGTNYTYTISRSHIVVKVKPTTNMPAKPISGTVLDSKGLPVIGAAVIVKGTNTAAIVDAEGKYSINAPGNATLLFSLMGYKDVEEDVNNRAVLNVVLEDDAMFLEEVVVVGYGVQKKENLTGAIAVVSSESIQNRSQSNLGNILQGTVPGLTVTSPSGRPGESTEINIRGWNSINKEGKPLVLVDGVQGSLDMVNPNDVESISVLKDASAVAVYGANGSYGVVLVTTKSGADNDGRAKVRYSSRFGFSSPTTSTDWETRGYYSVYLANLFMKAYNGSQQIFYNEDDMEQLWLRRNDKVENPERPWVVIDQSQGRNTYKFYGNTDWWHYFFNDRKPVQNHDVSFSGGTKTIKYFLSANYNREQGVFRVNPDTYNRYSLRARFSFQVTPWMSISNNTSYFMTDYRYPGLRDSDDTFYKLTAGFFPFLVPQTPDGYYVYQTDNGGGGQSIAGNLANKNFKNKSNVGKFTNTAELTLTPFKHLEIKANYTYSLQTTTILYRSVHGTFASQVPQETVELTTGDNEDRLGESMRPELLNDVNVFATYTNTFADAHNVKFMAGMNYETYRSKKLTAVGYDLLSQELNDQNLVSGDENGVKRTETGGGQSEYALQGFFFRLNYDYKGKYLFEAGGRVDGSSRFPIKKRFGTFPSFSLGWRVSQEPFFSPLKSWMNDAKVRFSYGGLGNQQMQDYPYIRIVNTGTQSYLFGENRSTYASFGAPVSDKVFWERVYQRNIGLDLAFLGNKITFTGDAYIRDTKGMVTNGKALPSVYGASAPRENNADLRTKGYELALTYRDQFNLAGKPFQYSVTATFNDFIGRITKFDNPDKDLSTYYEGMTYGEIWGYTTDGFFKTDDEAKNYVVDQSPVCSIIYSSAGEEHGLRAGDLKYVDLDGDNIIGKGSNTVDNPGDRKIIGNSQPRYQYGLNLGFNWYGFDFSIFLQGVGRQDWYPSSDARYFWGLYARPFSSWIQKDFHKSYWTEDNPDAYFPRPRAYVAMKDGRELGTVNDRYLQNLGYCRLKNLTFGYTLPQNLTKKLSIDSIRLYFSGENLACYSPGLHCDYIDPEAAAKTKDKYPIYPWQKTFMFGLDINF